MRIAWRRRGEKLFMSTIPLLSTKRIVLFVGEFGSGKTELAVNYAIQLQRNGRPTAIVDIDLVKPYFRTRENREALEDEGVLVIAPEGRLAQADLPILPQNLMRILADESRHVVIDVGGGESAIALAQIQPQLEAAGYEALLVVNVCRPFTNNADAILQMKERIEQVSGLTVTGLISNTNLAEATTLETVCTGLAVTEDAACRSGMSIRAVVLPEWLSGYGISYPLLPLRRYTHYPWMD